MMMRRVLWFIIEVVVIAVCIHNYQVGIHVLQQVGRGTPPVAMLPGITPIVWYPCHDIEIQPVASVTFECGHVDVPLDYTDLEGEKITLAMIRIPAQGQRIGAVFYNPGGPGGSGVDYVAHLGPQYVQKLHLEGFDFVGFDPRGVDRSGGLKCLTDNELAINLYRAYLWGFDSACITKYGAKLQFYSTENTARDMEVMRAAMGDTKISYLGVSYGTYLGAVYASMFPYHIRAMVLDSAYEPNGDTPEEQQLTQAVAFEQAFNRWIAWCERDTTCAFHAADVGAAWDALYAQDVIASGDGRDVNKDVLMSATKWALYSQACWRPLGSALAKLAQQDTREIWQMVDAGDKRNIDGSYKTSMQSHEIIMCASGIRQEPVTDADELIEQLHLRAPRFTQILTADDIRGGSYCDTYMEAMPVVPINYTGTAPVLIVGGQNDPATPLRWATKLRDEMGPNAVLLIYAGEGHGPVGESTCVDAVAADVLNGAQLPAAGILCPPDYDTPPPSE
jgi:pimeloyl-ACP methyl ester carboxylesterase